MASLPPNLFVRKTRGLPRRDYNALNNGLDALLPESSDDDIPEIERPCSPAPTESIVPEDQSEPSVHILSSSPPPLIPELSGLTSSRSSQQPCKRRKAKSYSSWTVEHFWVTELDNIWSRKGGPPKKDRLLVCKRCSWSSTDSARHGSTSNLLVHLQTKHRIRSGSDTSSSSTGETTLDQFLGPPRDRVDVEQMLIQWVVQTRQPFTVVEHPAFRALFEATGTKLPFKTADTLYNRIKDEFCKSRICLKQELARSCHTLALSLDVWTSENQVAIMGIIGHWISPEFEKREELLEFTDIYGPHSGENLAEIVMKMVEELDVAPKLLTITGDNAGNNGTLCDSLHADLLKKYDDEDDRFRTRPLMRFRGRQSFIPCLAHIINLICKDVLVSLRAGSAREAKAILDEMAVHSSLAFSSAHSTKGAIMKIRLLTLWIARSPQRRHDWKEVSPGKQVSYDVDTRWNSTYVMIADALRLRKELDQFVRIHLEVHALQLTDEEWSLLQQVAKVLKPFWDHTNSVSKSCPTIVESLPIYWSLDDLLDDVQKAEGDFEDVDTEIRDAVERGIRKMNKFARKMDDNLLYYVASVLDPRIKSSLIRSQMNEQDAVLIISQVREFLKKEYPHEPPISREVDRPPGMSETMWRTLRKVQPSQRTLLSDIDRYLDSPPVSWSHHMIGDADAEWVLKWWRVNAFNFPLMAKAARDYLPIPSAEVGIEREFSNARDMLGLRRHCLNAETMRWLMLLKGQYQR
jgi:hAT family protein